MKSKKFLFIAMALVIILVIGGILIYRKNRTQTATSYEDAGGWVWKCSQPITVRDQGVKYGSGAPSLTPTNQSEAKEYCHKIGIE